MLSDLEIVVRRDEGSIVIHPFDEADLGSCSYDVRLGEFYYESQIPRDELQLPVHRELYNIYSEWSVKRVWGKPKRAVSRGYALEINDDCINIADEDLVIMLHPRGNLLCHTREFIGARRGAVGKMQARSSVGRSMINVCSCAGQGDVGYFNRWTMEIHNRGDFHIPLVVGRRIAQISFFEVGLNGLAYGLGGKYQDGVDLDELVRSWKPEMMLPRLHKDRELRR